MPRGEHLSARNDFDEFSAFQSDWIIGLDEVGAGCLAGPLYAAAFAVKREDLAQFDKSPRVCDSKKLVEEQREITFEFLSKFKKNYLLEIFDVEQIEKLNIYQARMKAFRSLVKKVKKQLSGHLLILVDGPQLQGSEIFDKDLNLKIIATPKADGKYFAVAAASIVAKVSRDRHMRDLSKTHPEYLWHQNKGYATEEHRNAILKHGMTEHHRPTFCRTLLASKSE